GPLSDRYGRRPIILFGLCLFLLACVLALRANNLTQLIVANSIQGLGTGVGGVMIRTIPRDRYSGASLRHVRSLLNMGILVSPLLAPFLGGLFTRWISWRFSWRFMFLLCLGTLIFIFFRLPETRPEQTKSESPFFANYLILFNDRCFICYMMMLVSCLSGIAVFEASAGNLLGTVLGLDKITVSLLFMLPIPATFIGSWYAGQSGISCTTILWHSVICCLIAAILMCLPAWFHIMTVWTLLIPAVLFFFGAGIMFPIATTGAMHPFPYLAGCAGALLAGLQNVGSGCAAWLAGALPQHGQSAVGIMMLMVALIALLFWLSIGKRNRQVISVITSHAESK
ncbi:MAG: MFS transporter, partial [Enterobacteriaceae bacterium]